MKLNYLNAKRSSLNTGFSLIEMIVVVGIFAILSGVIFSNYGDFDVRASLDNLTHQVALVVREAQVYGISVSQSSSQFKGYGAYFSVTDSDQLLLFNDRNSDQIYTRDAQKGISPLCGGVNQESGDECTELIKVKTGDKVDSISGNSKGSSPIPLTEVNIVFTRPNPDAHIVGIAPGGASYNNLSDVAITLKSPRGATKKVVVWTTGLIAVE